MAERFRCSVASCERAEDLTGTASTVQRWLLVEQPGAWGRDAVRQSALPADISAELKRRARRHGVRVLLIRRCAGGAEDPPRLFAAWSGAEGSWLEELDLTDPTELLAVDLGGIAPGGGIGGRRRATPLLLTCTNGRHDACCAEFGRPVAAALEAAVGEAAWEVSHIGGDRFAPNVLALPHGVYFGRVSLDDAPKLAAGYLHGRLWLPAYRGRSIHPFPVQAAETALRDAASLDGLDEVHLEGTDRPSRDRLTAVFRTVEGRWRVDVALERAAEASFLTCQAERPARPPVHRVEALDRIG